MSQPQQEKYVSPRSDISKRRMRGEATPTPYFRGFIKSTASIAPRPAPAGVTNIMHRRSGGKLSVFKDHFQLPFVEYIHFGSNRDIRGSLKISTKPSRGAPSNVGSVKMGCCSRMLGETLVILANLHRYR